MRVLITGAGGQLGHELLANLEARSEGRRRDPITVAAAGRDDLDVSSRDKVLHALTAFEPDVVFHAAALTAVDECESERDLAFAVNSLGTRHVAEASRLVGAHLVYFSTDYVFDGASTRPYTEWDPVNPLSVYGLSKLAGEREAGEGATIVRTSWVVSGRGRNMARTVLRLAARGGEALRFVDDQRGCPTIAADLAAKAVELGFARRPGIYHVTNSGETTWYGFAREVVRLAGLEPTSVVPISTAELEPPRPAPRPANSVLDNAALRLCGDALLPPWEESLAAVVASLVAGGG